LIDNSELGAGSEFIIILPLDGNQDKVDNNFVRGR